MNDELQPQGQGDKQIDLDDDPLAELARIVAGEPEPDAPPEPPIAQEADLQEVHDTNVEAAEPDALERVELQLEELEQRLEPVQAEEQPPEEPVEDPLAVAQVDSLPVEPELAAEESHEPEPIEAIQEEVLTEPQQPVVELPDDDSFLDGLRSAIDSEAAIQEPGADTDNAATLAAASAAAAEDTTAAQTAMADADGFEDELITALSMEMDAANQQEIPPQEPPVEHQPSVEQAPLPEDTFDTDLEAALSSQLSNIEESLNTDQPVASEISAEHASTEPQSHVPQAEPVQAPEYDAAATVDANTHQVPHAMDEDLGAVFANEFEQILSNNPDHEPPLAQTQVEETMADPHQDDADGPELDFGTAFAEELGVENLIETQGWDSEEAMAANAAFAKAAQPEQTDHSDYADELALAEEDPDHSSSIPGIDDRALTGEAHDTSGGSKRYAIAALVIALFAGSIAAGYGFLGGGSSSDTSSPQLVKADEAPFKVEPDDPGGRVAANEDKASYESVEGQDTAAVEQETLVSETEEPAIVDETKLVEIDEPATNDVQKTAERLAPSENQAETATTPKNLTPRVVQTVTVKPDGTIVAGPSPSLEQVAEETASAAVDLGVNPTSTLAEELAAPKPVETTIIQKPEAIDGAQTTGQLAVPEASPLPKPEPVAEPEPVEVAAVEPEPEPQPEPQPAAASVQKSEWVVQVSSQRSPEAAQSSYTNLRNRFSVLQGRPMSIQRAIVNGSTFYRVRVQTSSRSDANQLCNSLQSSGGSCFVTR